MLANTKGDFLSPVVFMGIILPFPLMGLLLLWHRNKGREPVDHTPPKSKAECKLLLPQPVSATAFKAVDYHEQKKGT